MLARVFSRVSLRFEVFFRHKRILKHQVVNYKKFLAGKRNQYFKFFSLQNCPMYPPQQNFRNCSAKWVVEIILSIAGLGVV